jgi:hypothetical protein
VQHAQMPAAALAGRARGQLARQADVSDHRPGGLANRVSKRLKIIGSRAGWRSDVEPDDLPTEGGRQPGGVAGA